MKGYDADSVRACIRDHGAVPNIPNRSNRKDQVSLEEGDLSPAQSRRALLYKLKQFRRVATRYEKLGANLFAFVEVASVRIWLRAIESTA